ncbi:LiaF transmembrane domain-containing protein [Sediminibacterium soli]|uniref:LiaF transmembrane domain-containing protein n=1 Tax=Sediminibacterium soli TaxID=2698829 RepID=UPI00137AAFB8|nr:cell wall-active antibiotics response protein [Sediminibacterium soli]NCI46108.1 cell wall-active antibiotics response protein [Sediminibacterium soli]
MARNRQYRNNHPQDRFWTGFIFLIAGVGLLLEKMNLGLPYWLFTWPMLCIVIGLVIGIRHGFRNPAWLILMGVGAFFLSDYIVDTINFRPYFFPVMIIAVGLLFLFRPRRKWYYRKNDTSDDFVSDAPPVTPMPAAEAEHAQYFDEASSLDRVDSVSIFSGVKKVVTSKNFRGGDIVCFMGGAELILSQADIQGPVVLEIFQMFGGTKLVVPPHWEIRTAEAVAIFAGVEDKRQAQAGNFDPKKVLIVKGVTIFGGIEIKSY